MAKMPPYLGWEVQSMLDEGRSPDAKRIAADYLRQIAVDPSLAEFMGPEFFDAVAQIIDPKDRSKTGGAPKKSAPPKWYEIGIAYDDLRERDERREVAIESLAKRFKKSKRSIETALSYFNKISSLR